MIFVKCQNIKNENDKKYHMRTHFSYISKRYSCRRLFPKYCERVCRSDTNSSFSVFLLLRNSCYFLNYVKITSKRYKMVNKLKAIKRDFSCPFTL